MNMRTDNHLIKSLSERLFVRVATEQRKDLEMVKKEITVTKTYEALQNRESEFYTKSVEELMYLLELEEKQDIEIWERQAIWKY